MTEKYRSFCLAVVSQIVYYEWPFCRKISGWNIEQDDNQTCNRVNKRKTSDKCHIAGFWKVIVSASNSSKNHNNNISNLNLKSIKERKERWFKCFIEKKQLILPRQCISVFRIMFSDRKHQNRFLWIVRWPPSFETYEENTLVDFETRIDMINREWTP